MKLTNTKILSIAVVLLLLVNIGLVVFMLMNRKDHDGKRTGTRTSPYEMMVKDLGMTEQQQNEYKQMKEEHFKSIRPFMDSLRASKSAFFDLIREDNVNDSTLDAYSQRILERQSVIDKLTFAHFRRVRNLFKGDQQKKFDEFMQKMMQRGNTRDSLRRGPGGWKKDSAGKGKE